ncbi:hypothetical protein [Streptomyces xanthochromogenes]|uniref:hypothetical protein n=1 Tax=Streptomyces xanthochromogenes TaxID=67384 RepID=UPI00342F86D2
MFGAKTREIARLNRLLDGRTQQLAKTRVMVAICMHRIDRLGGNLPTAHRLERAVRACARYRRELAQERRVIKHLSGQLFDSLDYTPAARTLLGLPPQVAAEDTEPKP